MADRIVDTQSAREFLESSDAPVIRFEGDDVIVRVECRRCGGTGHHSFNLRDGTMCWGCVARGVAPVREFRRPVKRYAQEYKRRVKAQRRREEKRMAEWHARQKEIADNLQTQRTANEAAGHGPKTDVEVRAFEKQAARDRSRWLAEVGEKLTVTATVTTRRAIDTNYGLSCLVIFETDDRQLVKWFGSGDKIFALHEGDRVRVTGRVKDHTTYDGFRQTQITRARYEALEG